MTEMISFHSAEIKTIMTKVCLTHAPAIVQHSPEVFVFLSSEFIFVVVAQEHVTLYIHGRGVNSNHK